MKSVFCLARRGKCQPYSFGSGCSPPPPPSSPPPLLCRASRAHSKARTISATEAILEARPGYKPWFEPLWKPPSAEVETMLFALQAALGAGVPRLCPRPASRAQLGRRCRPIGSPISTAGARKLSVEKIVFALGMLLIDIAFPPFPTALVIAAVMTGGCAHRRARARSKVWLAFAAGPLGFRSWRGTML